MFHGLYLYWKSFVWPLLIVGLASAEVCDENSQYQCEEYGKCIPIMDRCNGTPDCKYGSDESFAECKAHLNDSVADMFYCASGILMIDEQLCNNVRDCPDGSDELPQLCEYEPFGLKFKDLNIQGKCRSSEIECLPGECVPKNKKCDGRIDCSNGRDESLELCLDSCRDCFKCANGVAINSELVCDNKIDCLDGSDELRNVCQGNSKSWIETLPAICIEPPDGKHRFTDNTIFHMRKETRFVYPNQPAELQCQSNNQTAWNVCMKDGSWNRELPSCTTMPKIVNRNPDTNGTNGCRMDWYNNETMIIYRLQESDQTKPIVPPITVGEVRFGCEYGNTFLPHIYEGSSLFCDFEETWNWSQENFNPRCTKLCRLEDLNIINSLTPTCLNSKDGSKFNCDDEYSLIPYTTVKFGCTEGFKRLTDNEYSVTCNENGIWEGLQELCLKQDKLCTYECGRNEATMFSANGVSTNSHHASWVVPIYTNPNDTQYSFACAGNLIELNIVLTAGHCVYGLKAGQIRVGHTGNRSQTIHESFYVVKHAESYQGYYPTHPYHDVGIIILDKRIRLRQDLHVVCLPYYSPTPLNLDQSFSNVLSWSADGYLMSVTGAITEPINKTGDVTINLSSNGKLCPGDSGAGLIVSCRTSVLQSDQCLVGVVSRALRPGEHGTMCSGEVIAASITGVYIQAWIEEVKNSFSRCSIS
ncbi:modular serine protease-like [Drosophila obscura]|uniref:modular serine protease-like n=1 Tax=Drosophila obscura TaxID=7282 RepID=UPI001BB2004D|nr:modular serine protease-like [Drosophila obscura]